MDLWTVYSQVLAQSPTQGWDSIFAVYGPFAPFAISSVVVIKILWDALKESRKENKELQDTIIKDVLPLVLSGTQVLQAATAAIENQEQASNMIIEVGERLEVVIPLLEKATRAQRASAVKKKAT